MHTLALDDKVGLITTAGDIVKIELHLLASSLVMKLLKQREYLIEKSLFLFYVLLLLIFVEDVDYSFKFTDFAQC